MTIDASFWVAISFLIFLGILIYFKIPQKIKNVLGFSTKYSVKDAVIDLKKAFEKKLLVNTFDDEMYFNIKRMNSIKLK